MRTGSTSGTLDGWIDHQLRLRQADPNDAARVAEIMGEGDGYLSSWDRTVVAEYEGEVVGVLQYDEGLAPLVIEDYGGPTIRNIGRQVGWFRVLPRLVLGIVTLPAMIWYHLARTIIASRKPKRSGAIYVDAAYRDKGVSFVLTRYICEQSADVSIAPMPASARRY